MKPFAQFSLLLAVCGLAGLFLVACTQSPAINIPLEVAPASSTSTVPFPSPTVLPTSLPSATVSPTSSPSPSPLSPTSSPTPSPPPPTPSASLPSPACLSQPGRIELANLSLDYLDGGLSYRVYLPPCYREQVGRSYPVLYLIHGLGYTDDQWTRLGITSTANALIASGQVQPFLIILPHNAGRLRPSKDLFGRALVEALIPWVDGHYRTLPGREFRAIGGLSRGAAWAVHLGLTQWQLFGAVGAHSLPVFLEDEIVIDDWIQHIPPEFFPRFYLDIGDQDRQDVLESAIWFEGLLTAAGVPHEWHLFSGDHSEAYWESHVEQYLRWYAAGW